MAERSFTFCDRCNPDMTMPNSRFPDNPSRGYVEGSESTDGGVGRCVLELGWSWRQKNREWSIICPDCVREEEK